MKKLALGLLCGVIAASAFAADMSKDEAAIKADFETVATAFNKADVKLFSSVIADDVDLVNPAGVYAKGRAEVEKLFQSDAEHIIAGGTTTMNVTGIRFVKADLAIVNAEHSWTGSKGPMPEGKVLVTAVTQKVKGKWLAIAIRPMVPVKPPAAPTAAATAAPTAPVAAGVAKTGTAPAAAPKTGGY